MRKFHFGNAILFLLVWALFVLTGFAVVCCAPSANGQTPTIPGLPRMVELSPVKEKAAPVTPPADSPTVDINKYRVFALKDSAGKEWAGPVTWEIEGDSLGFKEAAKPLTLFGVIQGQNEPTENDVPVGGVVIWGKQDGVTKLVAYGVVDNKAKKLFSRTFTVGQMPQPPPPVDPIIPKPKPVVTSFRVALVFESGQTMTAAQTNVFYGGVVEEWMTANCTGGKAGWRRRDRNADGDADQKFNEMWTAAKPALTTTPCVVVEVNKKIEIIPFEPTPAAMVAKLAEYKGK